jgi:hypothetical protein
VARLLFRIPAVSFAFAVEQLRRIPGYRWVERNGFWIALLLVFAAAFALIGWASQRSPQKISMAELVAGNLAPLQSWIIVSGELREVGSATVGHRYILTDASVPDASMTVFSDVELPVGQTTISGTLIGGVSRAHEGFAWAGQLRADPILAREPDPPWLAISLASLAALIVFGARTTYPMFFRDSALPAHTRPTTVRVGVRSGWPPKSDEVVPGTLSIEARMPVTLHVAERPTQRLRLHSAHSSADVGELRGLSSSVPALVVRPSTGELTFSFASGSDRDAAFAALLADAENPAGSPVSAD